MTRDQERSKILIVDDRPENILATRTVLRTLDAELLAAGSGEEALSLLIHHDFAVILLDVQMPGMDGFETARLILGNAATSHIPIIFVTAISKEERTIFEGYEQGAVDFLFKPIDPVILQSKVRVFLALHRQKEELRLAHAELEQRRRELEASNRELEAFAYAASHDLREPLRTVSSYMQLLQRRYSEALEKKAQGYIDTAVDATVRMGTLIDDLLRLSRVTTQGAEPRLVSCGAALAGALANLEVAISEAGAVIDRDEELPSVMADESQLIMLFQNLVGNAIKFRGDEPPRIAISAMREGDFWRLLVADNGIGMEPRYSERIFKVFQRLHTRTDYQGTGVGLALCKRVVERHGGKIWVESEEAKGSTFHFTLPA